MPFKKGQSGNPAGAKKGGGKRQSIAIEFQKFLEGEDHGKNRFEAAMRRLYLEDLKTFFAYAFGKPIETQVVQNPDGTHLFSAAVVDAARKLHEPKI